MAALILALSLLAPPNQVILADTDGWLLSSRGADWSMYTSSIRIMSVSAPHINDGRYYITEAFHWTEGGRDHWVLLVDPPPRVDAVMVVAIAAETPLVFADGFESGTTAAWSGVIGGI